MGKKKEQVKIVPMSIRQVTTISSTISLYEYNFIKKAVNDNNSLVTFSHYTIKSNKPFAKEEINTIIKRFRKEYGKNLVFEKGETLGEFYVGSFYLTEN
jgi:ribosomal protein L14E/L6E/L27E